MKGKSTKGTKNGGKGNTGESPEVTAGSDVAPMANQPSAVPDSLGISREEEIPCEQYVKIFEMNDSDRSDLADRVSAEAAVDAELQSMIRVDRQRCCSPHRHLP